MEKTRTTKIEYERHISAIQQWLLEDEPAAEINRRIISNGWCISNRHARRLAAAALKRWSAGEDEHYQSARKIASQRLREIIKEVPPEIKNTAAGLRALLAYEKEINNLKGITTYKEPPKKMVVNINEEL